MTPGAALGIFASARSRASYAATVLADSPVCYYRLAEASGTTMVDSSGNSRNGTYGGSPTLAQTSLLTTDLTDKSVRFNGSTQYATVPYGSWMNGSTGAFSIELWFKPTLMRSSGPPDVLLARRTLPAAIDQSWHLQFNTSPAGGGADPGGLRFLGFWGGNTYPVESSIDSQFVTGGTYHVVVTFNAGVIKFYVNGVDQGTTSGSHPAAVESSGSGLAIAAAMDSGSPGAPANATIDEVALYNTVLSPTRIAAHYAAR